MLKQIKAFFSSMHGSGASAIHICNDNNHIVAFDALRVVVFEEEPGVWTAQCIDLDYAASGQSPEDVKMRFQKGLVQTIRINLAKFGELDRFMRYPPPEENALAIERGEQFKFRSVTVHELQGAEEFEGMPFHKLAFLEPKDAA